MTIGDGGLSSLRVRVGQLTAWGRMENPKFPGPSKHPGDAAITHSMFWSIPAGQPRLGLYLSKQQPKLLLLQPKLLLLKPLAPSAASKQRAETGKGLRREAAGAATKAAAEH